MTPEHGGEQVSIQIKRWDGHVLYKAEGASDVRAALQEAVEEGANLHWADLYGANLRGANLCGADLREADLRGANLRGADLREADLHRADLRGADLHRADLRGADLREANLHEAYLYGANLYGADLREANLHEAYLYGANLHGADLRGADLHGAKGLRPEWANDLLILADQVGKVRAYKLVTAEGVGPYNGGITYEKGKTYEVPDADTDPLNDCGAGINLATLPWCIANWSPGYRILVAEFTAEDIAAIPLSDGKFRVKKAKIVGEKDCAELGLGA